MIWRKHTRNFPTFFAITSLRSNPLHSGSLITSVPLVRHSRLDPAKRCYSFFFSPSLACSLFSHWAKWRFEATDDACGFLNSEPYSVNLRTLCTSRFEGTSAAERSEWSVLKAQEYDQVSVDNFPNNHSSHKSCDHSSLRFEFSASRNPGIFAFPKPRFSLTDCRCP